VLTAGQLRAARALLGVDQKALADMAGVSVQTIQRMEASDGIVRGVVDSLMKVVEALDRAGIELIGDGAPSSGQGRGVRLKSPAAR
jgi:predicted transcriptional regulator